MSNIKQSDVKNHLSPRFRTQIHLCPPETEPDATGFSGEEPTGAEPKANPAAEKRLDLSAQRERTPMAIVPPKSVQD